MLAPDVETSGPDYAARFRGAAGRYLLDVQTRTVATALRGLRPGTLLELGGGHGQLVDALSAWGWDVTVHGSDAACEANLRQLHERRSGRFLLGDLAALPVADRSFDVVLSVRLLSHAADWRGLVGQMCRIARRAVVFDYPSTGALNALTPLLFRVKRSLEGNTRTYASFARADVRSVCAMHGFAESCVVKQFVLPMVVHRLGHANAVLRGVESAARATGLTALAGSPVIYRADRRAPGSA